MQRDERKGRGLFIFLTCAVLILLGLLAVLTRLLYGLAVPEAGVRVAPRRAEPRTVAIAESVIEVGAPAAPTWEAPPEPPRPEPVLVPFSAPTGPAFGPAMARRPGFAKRLKYDPALRADGVNFVFEDAGKAGASAPQN